MGNPVNAIGGSVTISGLPAGGWVAGQAYALTVRVQRTGQRVFGFQLSAVADATNQQAGTLTIGSGERIVCGAGASTIPRSCTTAGAIQYAEHSFPSITGVFNVTWTAPSDASIGMIRFNLGGNAANQDGNNTGDFIYTRVDRIAAVPPVDNSVRAFTLVDRGGTSLITDGSGAAPTVGYARIQPGDGNTTPSGVSIFGFRANNVLVSEAGVPATPALTPGRIYAEVSSDLVVDTGLAIANPNAQTATINFLFTNEAGVDFGGGSTTIPPNGQIAGFLDQAPFNSGAGIQGTFSFTSDVPVGVVALRGFTNQRGEFLITALPIIDTTAAPNDGTLSLPHFADGEGWTTQIVLVNPTDTAMTGTVQFIDPSGVATNVTVGGQTNSSFAYSAPRRSSQKLVTSGTAAATASGSVRIAPAAGGPAPTPLVIFTFKPAAFTVSEAGVPAISGTSFRMYVESSGVSGSPGNIQTGIAVANTSAAAATVTFELTNLDGSGAGIAPASISVPASGQTARFLAQIFTSLPQTFNGVLRISSTSNIAIVGLRGRYNERSDFLITTTPPTVEAASPTAAEFLFPYLVNGGGYTTQFILFSGLAGQSSTGNLRLVKQDGTSFNLTVN